MRRLIVVALFFFGVSSIQSCKQGCKDKSALNYNSKAFAENGTCLYCNNTFSADTATYFFNTFNFSDTSGAVEFIVSSSKASISGNGCRGIGKQPDDKCRNYLSIVNRTNLHMQGSFDAEYTENGVEKWFFFENQFIVLGPQGSGTDTLSFGVIDSTACSNLTIGTLSPNLGNLSFF